LSPKVKPAGTLKRRSKNKWVRNFGEHHPEEIKEAKSNVG